MKYIIEIDSKILEDAKKGYVRLGEIADAVKTTATPYNPSGDCISRDELKKAMWSLVINENDDIPVLNAIETIDNAQAVEISGLPKIHYDRGFIAGYEKGKAERPQGEWIDRMADKGYVECPFCHKQITGGDLNFCVKCGADMRGGAK